MKRVFTFLLSLCIVVSSISFASAEERETYSIGNEVINTESMSSSSGTRATGLIRSYSLTIDKRSSTVLHIYGVTSCDISVVKCGFKDFKVQKRLNSSSSWSTYHDYGNDYIDSDFYAPGYSLTVVPGYQYRVVCKHYAKKNIFSTQTISNQTGYIEF